TPTPPQSIDSPDTSPLAVIEAVTVPPPFPESKRITAVQESLAPWTPFADVAPDDELAAAFASVVTPSIPLPSSSVSTPFAELPVIEHRPEFAADAAAPHTTAPHHVFETVEADTRVLASIVPELATPGAIPVAIPRDVLVRAERLVNEQVAARRRKRWVFAAAGAVSFALCLFCLAPVRGGKSAHEVITLPADPTPAMVGKVLADAHLIRSAKGFALVAELIGLAGLRAGSYNLTTGQWPWQVARELTHGGSALHDVIIVSGLTLGQIAVELERAGVVSTADLVEAAHDERILRKFAITNEDAQGWLAPGAYAFADGIAARDIVTVMIERCLANLASIRATRDLAPDARNDVMVLASIVEREAKDKSEASRIAGLFANRLKLGMRLESRATAVYIIGVDKKELTLADVRQPSLYNTYVNAGLPPSPIASPSLEALRAAAEPEPNTYYYMVDKDDGGHVFSQTYEEHLKAQRANR
ncbi:MAG: endolytic transglycosylase MltG, partial [Clostridia bacterium]|nr:endolytic transglycosylase MltG [Deltaproteobacteria bacterium]